MRGSGTSSFFICNFGVLFSNPNEKSINSLKAAEPVDI